MLILKSASPRRKQILEDQKLIFQVEPSNINEERLPGEFPLSYLKRVSIAKLELSKTNSENIYIASDTIVVLGDKIFPKPNDLEDGIAILSQLSGKTHFVYSSLAIWRQGNILYDFDETKVIFKTLDRLEFSKYLEEYKPYDKAGGYGIQDENGPVLRYIGSYTNVMGFPLRKFFHHFGIWKEFLS